MSPLTPVIYVYTDSIVIGRTVHHVLETGGKDVFPEFPSQYFISRDTELENRLHCLSPHPGTLVLWLRQIERPPARSLARSSGRYEKE